MKRFLALALSLAVALLCVVTSSSAQGEIPQVPEKTKPPMESGIDISKLGKPDFTESKDGIKAQVWLVSREEHDLSLSGAGKSSDTEGKSDNPQANDPRKSAGSAEIAGGTGKPEVAIVVLDDVAKNVHINNAKVELSMMSPTNKTSTVVLNAMEGHYANDISFTEKGSYKVTLTVTRDGKTTTMTFATPITVSIR
jgi:hypothetical protein